MGHLFLLGQRLVSLQSKYLLLLCVTSISFFQAAISEYPRYCSLEEGEECQPGKVCVESRCVCNVAAGLVYSEEFDDCHLLAGRKCGYSDEDFECVPNAICSNQTEICECESDFVTDGEGECKRGYLSNCDDKFLCNVFAFLNCDPIDNTCKCTNKSTMVYDPAQASCVSTLGNQCELVGWMGMQKGCVSHGTCFSDNSMKDANFFGVCICKAGYSPDLYCDEKCALSIYGRCESHTDCATHFCSKTDSENWFCDCPPYSTYDSSEKVCRIKAGGSCQGSKSSSCKSSLDNQVGFNPFPCAISSYCDPRTNSCVCNQDYVRQDGACALPMSTLSPKINKSTSGPSVSFNLLILLPASAMISLSMNLDC